MAASTSNRQDRSYYKSLYNFNADVELAEYSLPVLSNQQPGKAKGGLSKQASQSAQGRASSGVINATHLPPLSGQPEGIEEEGMMEEMDMQMDQMGDPYGQEDMGDMEGMMEDEYGE
jgi:hypothetical protein